MGLSIMIYGWLVGICAAVLGGMTAFLFRRGGAYNPVMPSLDHELMPEIPLEPPVESKKQAADSTSVPFNHIVPPTATIANFCLAIAEFEGGPGDANHRNNNPGNARYNPSGYMPFYGEVKKSEAGFAIFKDWDTGMLYLVNMIKGQIHAHPDRTIYEFMQNYAPSSENPTLAYAQFIGKHLGVDCMTFMMKNLV